MRIVFVFLLTISSFISFQPNVQAEFQKTKIAVLDFRLQGNEFGTEDMGKIVAEWLITAFVRQGRFEVIERKLLGEVLEEQKMVEAGIVDQETASEIGKLLGVKVIISGSVARIQNLLEVNARIVDVASASIITAESVSSSDVTSLRELVKEMAVKIIKNFPLEGYVAHRSDKEVVIDLGQQSGVKSGMTFLVYKEGEVVKHPKTGEILYVSKIEIGIIRITAVQAKIASGVIIDEADEGQVSYGDMIKSIPNGRLTRLPNKQAEIAKETEFFDPEEPQEDRTSASSEKNDYSATGLDDNASSLHSSDSSPARLLVTPSPTNALIRILNIVPRYTPGMELPPAKYHIEVSASGYQTKYGWYELQAGEEKVLYIQLEKSARQQTASPGAPYAKYFTMIMSHDSSTVQRGAKYLYRKYKKNQEVINKAHSVLEQRYMEKPDDRHFVDGMAYLCNILGVSGQKSHKPLLSRISKKAGSRKLQSYALKNYERL